MDDAGTEEIKRHFNVVAEGLRSEIRLLAEAQGATVERLDRFGERVAAEFKRVHEDSAETRAMIRLSFGELDRRITALEGDLSALRARLDRLETRSQTQ